MTSKDDNLTDLLGRQPTDLHAGRRFYLHRPRTPGGTTTSSVASPVSFGLTEVGRPRVQVWGWGDRRASTITTQPMRAHDCSPPNGPWVGSSVATLRFRLKSWKGTG